MPVPSALAPRLPGAVLQRLGEVRAPATFHRASREVPAYRRFLAERGVTPASDLGSVRQPGR